MPLPTQRPTFLKYYVLYVPSVLAASSPAIPIMGRGRVVDIRYVPIAAVATASQTVTPKVNATQMQLNGSNVTGTLTSGASVNAVDAASVINPNGLNIVDVGDVVVLTLSGSGTAGAGYFTVTVDERSI